MKEQYDDFHTTIMEDVKKFEQCTTNKLRSYMSLNLVNMHMKETRGELRHVQ